MICSSPRRHRAIVQLCVFVGTILVFSHVTETHALDAQQILDESVKRNTVDSFRIGVQVKTSKPKKKPHEHYLWLIGRSESGGTSMFIQFQEPKHARGLRFLFRFPETGSHRPIEGFMFIPATRSYVKLKPGGRGGAIGGTGLTIQDFRGFVPERGAEAKILGEEKINGDDCYIMEVRSQATGVTRKYWISKKDFLLVKSETFGPNKKPIRSFNVLEFFTRESGQRNPRKEEIIDKRTNTRIELVQDSGVYNVEIAPELFNPKRFGTVKWGSLMK